MVVVARGEAARLRVDPGVGVAEGGGEEVGVLAVSRPVAQGQVRRAVSRPGYAAAHLGGDVVVEARLEGYGVGLVARLGGGVQVDLVVQLVPVETGIEFCSVLNMDWSGDDIATYIPLVG